MHHLPLSGRSVLIASMLLILWPAFASIAIADEVGELTPRDTAYYNAPPTAEDIGQHLFPDAAGEGLSRSITFKDSQADSAREKSVSMPILFHFGQTTIVEKSRPFLDSIGLMLRKPEYLDRTLVVEGHTDAVGPAASNQRLSELRALAIKEYLVTRYTIDPYRLFPIGQGESMLVRPEAPTDGANRRVEFLPYKQNGQ